MVDVAEKRGKVQKFGGGKGPLYLHQNRSGASGSAAQKHNSNDEGRRVTHTLLSAGHMGVFARRRHVRTGKVDPPRSPLALSSNQIVESPAAEATVSVA